ncbi:MAG: hypothetical protein AAGE94_17440 [Acidobacteriota bacterium]
MDRPPGRPGDEPDLGRAVCERLIASVDHLRRRHPWRAPARARAARDFVATLEPGTDRIGWLHLQVAAWGALGSAQRTVGDLVRAERALTVAAALLASVPTDRQDHRIRARLLQRASYLRSDQGRITEALTLNRDVVRGFEHVGDRQEAASALLDRALFVHRSGRSRAAIPMVERALQILDPSVDPRRHRAALHNLAVYHLASADRGPAVAEACAHVDRALDTHGRDPDPLSLLKLWGAVAFAATRLGPREEALEALRQIQDEAEALGSSPTRAMVLLRRLAEAVEDGRRSEANRLAGRLYPLLRRLDLPAALRTELVRGLAAAQGRPISIEAVRRIARQMAELAGDDEPT